METHHVRYFLAICEEGSFTRAAQKCGVKQPTISEAIKRFERAIGGDLFLRTSPVELTSLGSELRPVCIQINELMEEVRTISISKQNPDQCVPPISDWENQSCR